MAPTPLLVPKDSNRNHGPICFFSFHYQGDIMRVQQVKQHYLTRGSYTEAGFFDGSLEERAKRDGDLVVKKMIDDGLRGSSVLAVLIGAETYQRRWVDYEILRSVSQGMAVFGIRIHQLRDPTHGVDSRGANPFDYLGYGERDGNLFPMVKYQSGWKDAPYQAAISRSTAAYLRNTDRPVLSSLFSVYDWVDDSGYDNFGTWVERAAAQAAR